MPHRTYDYKALDKVVEDYKDAWVGFDAQLLVENEDNVLLTDGQGNYGLFEFDQPGIYYGHYMFSHKGIKTLPIAKSLLTFFFENVPCTEVRGLTPVEHTGALKLTKALGFTLYNVVDTEAGPHVVSALKKEDFK